MLTSFNLSQNSKITGLHCLNVHTPWDGWEQSLGHRSMWSGEKKQMVEVCAVKSLLLMAEIPNNHLGWCWNPINNGINYLSTGAGFQPSTVSTFKIQEPKMQGILMVFFGLFWAGGDSLADVVVLTPWCFVNQFYRWKCWWGNLTHQIYKTSAFDA